MQVLGQRRRQRQDVGGQLAHLLGHLQLRHARRGSSVRARRGGRAAPRRRRSAAATARRRGPAAGRRRAGSRRPAPGRSGAAPSTSSGLSSRSRSERRAEDDEDALDQLRLEAGLARHLLDRDLLLGVREEVLGEAEGEPPLAARLLQLLERVAALAHPRDHPGLRRGGGGPAAAPHRDHLLRRPALERARRDPASGARPRSGICVRQRIEREASRGRRLRRRSGAAHAAPLGSVVSTGRSDGGNLPPRAPAAPAPRPRRCGCESPPPPAGRRSCRRRPRPCGRA